MTAVLLTIHTILVVALVGVVLLQRSEGGALGMGGGGGGGMMSGRGAANALTRTTTVLAALFFTTSMVLAITSDRGLSLEEQRRLLTGEEAGEENFDPADVDASDILDLGTGGEVEIQQTEPVTFPDPTEGIPGTADDDGDQIPDPEMELEAATGGDPEPDAGQGIEPDGN